MSAVLSVHGLTTAFPTGRHANDMRPVLEDVSFELNAGQVLALVGESGCGKSMTALSVMRLVPRPGRVVRGEILLDGRDILKLSVPSMRAVRGDGIGMIFQEPMTSLNPVVACGEQVVEALRLHEKLSYAAAKERTVRLFTQVGIPDPAARFLAYPHQLSGGLKQRVMIAMALCLQPRILIADEPTTALDVTIQAQILDLILDLRDEFGMAVMIITHNMGVVAETADRVMVMYAGRVIEEAPVATLFDRPLHPYTRGLLECVPSLGQQNPRLVAIPGTLPEPARRPEGCRFAPRCRFAQPACRATLPVLAAYEPGHSAACIRVPELVDA